MAKAKKESTAVDPAVDIKEDVKQEEVKEVKAPKAEKPVVESKSEVKESVVEKPEAPKADKAPKEKEEPTPCEKCSFKFDSAPCKSCIIYKRLKK